MALAIHFLKQGISTGRDREDQRGLQRCASVTLQYENGAQQVYLNGENVTGMTA